MRETFEQYCARKRAQYGEQFDPSVLDPRFVPYFESGERIKIDDWGEPVTGTISVSRGWRPTWLLMRRKNAYGSSICPDHRTKILAVKRGRKYVNL